MTNFESIKNMSVDAMSEFLMDWAMQFMMWNAPMNVKRWLETEVDFE